VNNGRTEGAGVPGAAVTGDGAGGGVVRAGGVNGGRAAGGVADAGFSQGSLGSILGWAGGGIDGVAFCSPTGSGFCSARGSVFGSGRSMRLSLTAGLASTGGGGAGFGSGLTAIGGGSGRFGSDGAKSMGMAATRSAVDAGPTRAGAGWLDSRSPGCKSPSFSSSGRENANSRALTSVRIFPPSRT